MHTGIFGARTAIVVGVVFVLALAAWPSAQSPDGGFEIVTVSARPDFVSGGDVLVRVRVPGTVPLDEPRVMLNGADVTGVFHQDNADHSLTGLVTGLTVGANTMSVVPTVQPGSQSLMKRVIPRMLSIANVPMKMPAKSRNRRSRRICRTRALNSGIPG